MCTICFWMCTTPYVQAHSDLDFICSSFMSCRPPFLMAVMLSFPTFPACRSLFPVAVSPKPKTLSFPGSQVSFSCAYALVSCAICCAICCAILCYLSFSCAYALVSCAIYFLFPRCRPLLLLLYASFYLSICLFSMNFDLTFSFTEFTSGTSSSGVSVCLILYLPFAGVCARSSMAAIFAHQCWSGCSGRCV